MTPSLITNLALLLICKKGNWHSGLFIVELSNFHDTGSVVKHRGGDRSLLLHSVPVGKPTALPATGKCVIIFWVVQRLKKKKVV